MNENGVAATGLVTCIGNWYEGALPNAPGYSMTNADAYRLQSLGGAAACPGKPMVGLIGVEVATLTVTPLNEKGVTGYEFDVFYDPTVLSAAKVSAEVAGTVSEGMVVMSTPSSLTTPVPGWIRPTKR